jgi:hypothetical protein
MSHNTQLQTILHSHSNKNCMIPAQTQPWRPKQNRRPRYESTQWLPEVPKTYDGEKTASLTNVAGKTGYLYSENWN